jgi:hypothetical protein
MLLLFPSDKKHINVTSVQNIMSVYDLQQLKATDPRTLRELLVKVRAHERVLM